MPPKLSVSHLSCSIESDERGEEELLRVLAYLVRGGPGEFRVFDDTSALHALQEEQREEHLTEGERVGVGELVVREHCFVEDGDAD
jgi:hypothetical protein